MYLLAPLLYAQAWTNGLGASRYIPLAIQILVWAGVAEVGFVIANRLRRLRDDDQDRIAGRRE